MRTLIPSALLLAFALAACGDFDSFDRRLPSDRTKPRRVTIEDEDGTSETDSGASTNPSSDGGVPKPKPDSGSAPKPDSSPTLKPDTGGSTGACGNTNESEVFRLVNQERAKQGLPAFQCDLKAGAVARAYSKLMCTTGHFSHTGPDGSSPWTRLQAGGVSFYTAGENIAAGQSTPSGVMNSWMNSSGHRANILSSSFTHIGVGYDNCGQGYGHYWTQVFFK